MYALYYQVINCTMYIVLLFTGSVDTIKLDITLANHVLSLHVPSQMFTQTLHKHYTNITQTLHKHYTNITQTLHKHYTNITQTLHKHYTNITQTLHKHYTNITQTLHKHYTNITQTFLISHLLQILTRMDRFVRMIYRKLSCFWYNQQ